MRYVFLSLALASAFMATLLAFAPNASSHERTNSGQLIFAESEQAYAAPASNLPTVKNFNADKTVHCWDPFARLLTALDSKECS